MARVVTHSTVAKAALFPSTSIVAGCVFAMWMIKVYTVEAFDCLVARYVSVSLRFYWAIYVGDVHLAVLAQGLMLSMVLSPPPMLSTKLCATTCSASLHRRKVA